MPSTHQPDAMQLPSVRATMRGLLVVLGTAAILCVAHVSPTFAGSGDLVVVPLSRTKQPAFSKQSGVQIQVDTTWVGNRGYRPATVTATLAKPATSDTLITINYYAGTWSYRDRIIQVERDFEIPQGATSATIKFSIPQYVDWNTYGWDVWVDGAKDDQLCLNPVGFNGGNNGAIAVGVFSRSATTSGELTRMLQSATGTAVDIQTLDLANLPDTWLDYSMLDLVVTTIESLELARVSSPDKLANLLRWTRAGGNLWVTGVGTDYAKLDQLDAVLGPDDTEASEAGSEDPEDLRQWRFVKLNGSGRTRLMNQVRLSMDLSSNDQKLSRQQVANSTHAHRASDSRHWFVARSFGLGTIVAIQSSSDQRRWRDTDLATAIQRSDLNENLQWSTRHGNDPAGGNPNFNHLLIADVGTAPVLEFQLLITLFVIGIGPVNYWLLKRRNKLPMLLLTVPVAAFGATAALFTYGFLADGIGANVRARTVTVLDQQAGEVATWARLSYYAGIAPSDGLRFPKDTTVYPILPARSSYSVFGRRDIDQQRALGWNDQQQLTLGWLASRTPTQYLAITSRPTQKRLDFKPLEDNLRVTNKLGTKVVAIIVQDHEGKFYVGETVSADNSAKLKETTYIKAASTIRKLLTENIPQLPLGLVESRRSWRGSYGPSISDSLMELQLEALMDPTAVGLGNGSFVAVTTDGIDLPLGLDNVTETEGFHLVRGTW